MHSDIQRWLKQDGVLFFREIGLRRGDRVLDFGCGEGNYAIPAARTVGPAGSVYALDKNRGVLESLMERASVSGISNIVPLHDLEELRQLGSDRFLDVVLLYDVIHSYYFTGSGRLGLLACVGMMVKQGGLVSIFPRHTSRSEKTVVRGFFENGSYYVESEKSYDLVHDSTYDVGEVMNFGKRGQ